MPTKFITSAALAVLSSTLISTTALAGACGIGVNCNTGVEVIPGNAPTFGSMSVQNQNPMGHLRTINFQRSPNVSITRIHGMGPSAGLSDAPTGFTQGCFPQSTQYCRQDMGTPVNVQMNAPVMPAPVYSAPAPQTVYTQPAPVISAPAIPTERTIYVGKGYDPSKFTPRVYGDATMVPGIAHVPTSIVDRDPVRAQAVLDSGRTVPQSTTLGGQVPTMAMMGGNRVSANTAYANGPVMAGPAPMMAAPMMGAPMMGAPAMGGMPYGQASYAGMNTGIQMQAPGLTNTAGLGVYPTRMGPSRIQPSAPVLTANGTYGSNVAPDGTYWEKVSGPTAFGSTIATQVICKRKLPSKVVNPVVGVPTPVPTPVPGCVVDVPHNGPHAAHRYGR